MSKLFELLNSIISKLNLSVKMESQELTDEQKSQVRENIGAASIDDIGEGSVEQVQTDYNQEDSTQPDYIKNRPFYGDIESSTCIVTDPSSLPYIIVEELGKFIKIFDFTLTKNELENNTSFTITSEDIGEEPFKSNEIYLAFSSDECVVFLLNEEIPMIITYIIGMVTLNVEGESLVFDSPETGVYFMDEMLSPGYMVEIARDNRKTLDIKYLPKNMALGYESKPFENIVWDGNTEGLTNVSVDVEVRPGVTATYKAYKVSDQIPTKSDIVGATMTVYQQENDSEESIIIADDDLISASGNGSFYDNFPGFYVVTKDNDTIDMSELIPGLSVVMPKAGVWFVAPEIGGVLYYRTTSLIPRVDLKKIDKKFLPSTLPEVTSSDSGKFLRVNSNGDWYAAYIQSAEGVGF